MELDIISISSKIINVPNTSIQNKKEIKYSFSKKHIATISRIKYNNAIKLIISK